MDTLPDFEQTFITLENSIGEYVYGDCPTCAAQGYDYACPHTILICRNCGAPPTAKGCICDAMANRPMSKLLS